MGRKPCCDKIGLKQGPWTPEEDKKLIDFILGDQYQCCWRNVPKHAGLLRCGKSCRLRWTNYLRPDLKRGVLSEDEEKLIIDLHSQLGNKWSKIASHMPGRTDNEIKNLWHTHIKKKLRKMGIDPVTHKPLPSDPLTDQTQNHGHRSPVQEEEVEAEETRQDKVQENDGNSVLEELAADDHIAKEKIAMDTNNAFSIDEVPLMQPNEILFPHSDQPSCSSTFLSTTDLILEDFNLPSLEDWPNEPHEIFNDGFYIDEGPSSEPHEISFPNSDVPSCSSSTCFSITSASSTTTSMPTINSVPEEYLPCFEDCPGEYYDGENMRSLHSDGITDWDWLFNYFDVTKINHEIIHSPRHLT